MKKTIISLISAAAVLLLSVSCSDKLDIPKNGSLDFESYYNTDSQAESAVAAIYFQQRDIEFFYMLMKNLFSDDFWAGGSARNDNPDLEAMNEYTFDTNNSYIRDLFQSYYQIIYKANVVLAYVEPDSPVKAQMVAEAKVFRAWSYFELITLWGNPPLVDHPLSPSEYEQPNGSTEELWALVENDLLDAIGSSRLVSKKSLSDDTVYRVTKEYAYALLGKAYLWQKKYSEAAEAFEKVIGSGLYDLYRGEYKDVLASSAKNNCESLFESNRAIDKDNIWDNYRYYMLMVNWRMDHFSTVPSEYGLYNVGYGYCMPRKSLYDAFVEEEGEDGYRLNQSIKTFAQISADGAVPNSTIYGEGYFNYKIRYDAVDALDWGCCTNNQRWMRYSEVLLCAAEAYSRIGDEAKVKTFMDMIRSRAKAPIKSSYTLLDVKNEKRLELFGECVRFQDLLRYDDDNDGTGASTVLREQGKEYPLMSVNGVVTFSSANTEGKYGFQSRHAHLPYPYIEISQNPAIRQNEGWQ
ncbi:MAG: RagB/SusD family nutrient uptake outer membrane protein [Bacteroidales bacterium]|nr:RagB/SusD family nutrient uptake outer membrane protein [Bacteroidales bacterium]